jgi:hypothetical protein
MTPYFTAREMRNVIPMSEKQLAWWHQRRIVSPSIRQGRAGLLYSAEDLFGAILIRELVERRFEGEALRYVWQETKRQARLPREERAKWLLTNGQRVIFLDHADVVLAFLEQRRSPLFALISLDSIAQRVEEGQRKFNKFTGPGATAEGPQPPTPLIRTGEDRSHQFQAARKPTQRMAIEQYLAARRQEKRA